MSSNTETFNGLAEIRSRTGDSNAGGRGRRQIRKELKQKSKVPGNVAWTKWMHSDAKNPSGEFVGTTLFLFFAFAGKQTANINSKKAQGNVASGSVDIAALLYISMSFGFSLMVNAWAFFRISGGWFSPAHPLSLALTRDLHAIRAILLVISQVSEICFAAYLVIVMFPGPLNFGTTLSQGTTSAQGVRIEAICTAGLVFTIIMVTKEKHRATGIAPVGIGLSLFIGELVAVYYTGGSLNPARSFGHATVADDFLDTQWIYWVGPCLGFVLAIGCYRLIKVREYEMANLGQDGDYEKDPTKNLDHEIAAKFEERQAVEEIRSIEEAGGFHTLTNDDEEEASHEGDRSTPVIGKKKSMKVRIHRVRALGGSVESGSYPVRTNQ
ncbi:related to aquaporin [Phialocephala subalpina]|uniref:Related to aquaporin n=1 Tax=Phialocephala subalpina TaxID=576137 RepID=A0A1L7WQT4_9HELO|nr:related to aquaporin [Phialocephala subalpina]